MQTLRDHSIRQKITSVILLISSGVLLLAVVALFVFQAWSIKKNITGQLVATGVFVADNVAAAAMSRDEARASQAIAGLRAMPQIIGASLLSNDGSPLAHYGVEDIGQEIATAPLESGIRVAGSRLLLAQPVERDGRRHGTLYLRADFGAAYASQLTLLGGILAIAFAASLLLAFVLSRRFGGTVTAPLVRLVATARQIAEEKDYAVRAKESGGTEVGTLASAFNQVLAQIQAEDAALQAAQQELHKRIKSHQREFTERKRAETAQKHLLAIVEGTPDFIGSADATGRVLYLNAAARRMVGLAEAADVSSMRLSDFHPGWAARIVSTEGIPEAIHDGSWAGETALRHRDGREFYVSQVIIAHKSPTGGFESLSTVMRDITERKAGEEALRLAELKFRGLVEQLPAITYHAAPGEIGTWTYVSPQVFTLLGFTPEEWLRSERLWLDQIHPDDRAVPIEGRAVARRTGSFLAEYRMFTRSGELRWFRDHAVFVAASEQTDPALYGVMMDITDAKAAEARLADLNKQLVDTSRHAGMAEVATGVLHNVGNVLNSVNVSAGLVLDKLRRSKVPKLGRAADLLTQRNGDLAAYLTQDPNGQKLPGYLAKLGQYLVAENSQLIGEVDQLTRNIEHIKEVVDMQQSYAKVSGVFEILPLDRLVEDAIAMNIAAIDRHGVTITRDFHPAPAVRVDRHKVLQILINLIRNAKYALDEIQSMDKRITISIEATEASVRIGIADNGVGIPAENLERIFAHGFTTRKDGHGFGLHSGALAAKEMGGSLHVHSDGHGHGATFTLELPIVAKPSHL